MKTIKVLDKIHNDIKEVAVINYIEKYVLLWTGNKARITVKRWFDDIEEIWYQMIILYSERSEFIYVGYTRSIWKT